MAHVQVLGTGCARCAHLMKRAEEAVGQLNQEDSVEKVDDIVKILDFAPTALPALARAAAWAPAPVSRHRSGPRN